MAEDNQFDIIGALITKEGKIGENLATQIFSLLDISSLVRVRRVSRTWNQFLKVQKSIWMEKLRRTEDFLGHLDWELFSGRKGLNNPYNLGRFPEWENLFDAFEKYGTLENMMEVYFDIQRIAALHHKILFTENVDSFIGSGGYLAQDYFLTRIAPYFSNEIFEDSYIGEELKNEIGNFVDQYRSDQYKDFFSDVFWQCHGGDDIQKKLLNKIRLKFERFHNHEYTDMLKFEELYERMWHFTELDQISNDGYEDSDSDYGGYYYGDYSD